MNLDQIAYFSMEIALRPEMPTYAGGLGILAGDTLRAAADLDVPLIGDHVILRGSVRAWWERDEAERIAWSIQGVCHVDNNRFVEPSRGGGD